jgi:pyridoxamine 5'-phosphate oxidase
MADTGWLRREYESNPFLEQDLAPTWWQQFDRWFAEARSLTEPNAMVVATADGAGQPRARTVLLKSYDATGFVWATNYTSKKGQDLEANPSAGLLFPWHDLARQVQAEGTVEKASPAESDVIWAARPRMSRLSALASEQSAVLASRGEIEARLAALDASYGTEVPRPEHWGGYRLRPRSVEFWQGRRDRLHDRLRFRCVGDPERSDGWVVERLNP